MGKKMAKISLKGRVLGGFMVLFMLLLLSCAVSATYDNHIPINCSNISTGTPIVINGTNGFNLGVGKNIVWTNCQAEASGIALYYDSGNLTDYDVKNNTDDLPFEVESGTKANSATFTTIWNDYYAVYHMMDYNTTAIFDSTIYANHPNQKNANNITNTSFFIGNGKRFNTTDANQGSAATYYKTGATGISANTPYSLIFFSRYDLITEYSSVMGFCNGNQGRPLIVYTGQPKFVDFLTDNVYSMQLNADTYNHLWFMNNDGTNYAWYVNNSMSSISFQYAKAMMAYSGKLSITLVGICDGGWGYRGSME